jgi:integrase
MGRIGSSTYQINEIFKESEMFKPGESKHLDKLDAYAQLRVEGKPATPTNVSSKTSVHSYAYARDLKDTWHQLGRFAREHGVRDLRLLGGQHARAFLEARIAGQVGLGTWNKEAAHIGKFGDALGRLGNPNDIRAAVNEMRDFAKGALTKSEVVNRAFSDPGRVVAALSGAYATAAKLQWDGGARIHEANRLGPAQLEGISRDPHTGREIGQIRLNDTKGGKERTIQVTPSTYREVEKVVARDGSFRVSYNGYRSAVSRAAESVGEAHRGTHSFRYSFAQERYQELTGRGRMTHEAAIQQISWLMGHERAEITLHYLGR